MSNLKVAFSAIQKDAIIKHLSKDKRLVPLLKSIKFPEVKLNKNLYASLVEAIISQQLSIAAAKTIHTRFLALFNHKMPGHETLLACENNFLRTAGISNQKAGYLKDIAEFALQNTLNYHDIKHLNDEELINYLCQIKGVGRWTAEMILMFNLQRLNILPLDDLGIQNSMKKLYGINEEGKKLKEIMLKKSANWEPYKSIACMYLWRWKDEKKA